MSAGIMEFDKGFLAGGEAWHHDPKYIITGENPVTYEQASEVAAVPVNKVELSRMITADDINEIKTVEGAFCLVRPDHNVVLAPMVGRAYHATPHQEILDWVNEILLQVYPDLHIMGCGTMMNGAQFFLQLQAKEFFVNGDESANNLKLLYGQHYGVSAHICAAVIERVVCQNTWKMAISEAELAGKIKQHKHTRNAAAEVVKDLDMMANLYLQLDKHILLLEGFTQLAVDSEYLTAFLDSFYPVPKEEGRAQTIALNHRLLIQQEFESVALAETLAPFARNTRYALWQAFSGHVDHDGNIKNGDDMAKDWDCRLGTRAAFKSKACAFLASGQVPEQEQDTQVEVE